MVGFCVGWRIIKINDIVITTLDSEDLNAIFDRLKNEAVSLVVHCPKVVEDVILCSGYLTKHTGLGKRSYSRFFTLGPNSLNYYVSENLSEKKGSIPLTSISDVFLGVEATLIKYEH